MDYRETWRKVKLGDICKLNKFKQISATELSDLNTGHGDVRLLPSSKDYDWWCDSKSVDSNLICDGEVITFGRARYANMKYHKGKFISAQNHIIEALNKDDVDMRYLYYILELNKEKFYDESSAYPLFNRVYFDEFEVYLPPLSIQHKISSILSAYDSLISSTDDKSSNLRLAKQQLMNNIFSERERVTVI